MILYVITLAQLAVAACILASNVALVRYAREAARSKDR